MFFEIEKKGERLVVNQSTLSEHQSLGWIVLGEVETEKAKEDLSKLKTDELKTKLTEKGIPFNLSAKKDELIALLQDNS